MDEGPSDVIIIGSGPAGLTAAIYTARANLDPLVIEGEAAHRPAGGQLMLTTEVENFPGFVDGIMGPELMARCAPRPSGSARSSLTRRATARGSELVDRNGSGSTTRSTPPAPSSSRPEPRPGCWASRASARSWATASRRARPATGTSSAASEIAVVGGGDSAMEEAIFLTKFAQQGHRRPSSRVRCGRRRSCRTRRSPTRRSSSCGTRP